MAAKLFSINNYHYRRGGSDVVYLEHAALMESEGWKNAFFSMRHGDAKNLKMWAVDQAEKRVAEGASRADNGFLRFSIDNLIPAFGPVTYFEVADH